MHISNVLVTGASRGLGLEFVKQFLKLSSPPNQIFAACRNPSKADELQKIAKANSSVKILQLDITDEKSFPEFRQQLEKEIGDAGLNLLINNAGINMLTNLENTTKEMMMECFEVDAVSPLLLTKELLPLLKTAASKVGGEKLSCSRAAVVNITSDTSSIQTNTNSGYYPYRASKIALNMITKNLSIDLKPHGILVFVVHPGWVKTALGGKHAPLDTETSIAEMLKVIENASDQNSDVMSNYDGKIIPW